ncbi:MAG: NADH-quinone oxidoreductase subunit J [Campylobacterales bacterium]
MFETIAFYTFAILTTVMFLITIFSKNALYAMTSLAAGMIFISGFFFLLDADFLGVVQIVVYTGAVMALYAFGMMFFDVTRDVKERVIAPRKAMLLAMTLAIVFLGVIITAPFALHAFSVPAPMHPGVGNAQDVGYTLFTTYLIPFEVASVMLLVAMVAGIVLASKKMDVSFTTTEDAEITPEIHKEFT